MNRLDRITAILIQLQSRKVVKAQDIADRFDISLRTVYRDVRSLEEAGIPIIGEAGVGYSIMDGYKLPPVMFTQQEATALLTAEKLVNKLTDKATAEEYKNAMYKIRAVLRGQEKGMLEDIENVIQVYKHNLLGSPGYMYEILKSISDKKAVLIQYYANYTEQLSERMVEPVGLYYIGHHWHLVGWCRLRNDYRDFRLDRIQNLKNTDIAFTQKKMTLKDYMDDYLNRNKLNEVVVIFNKRTAQMITEQKFYHGFSNEQVQGDKVRMTFLAGSLYYFATWLVSFGKEVTVVSPLALKEHIAELVEELRVHYS